MENKKIIVDTNIIIQIKNKENWILNKNFKLNELEIYITYVSLKEIYNQNKNQFFNSLMHLINEYNCYFIDDNLIIKKIEKNLSIKEIYDKYLLKENSDILEIYYKHYKSYYETIKKTRELNVDINNLSKEINNIKKNKTNKEIKINFKEYIKRIKFLKKEILKDFPNIRNSNKNITEEQMFFLHEEFLKEFKGRKINYNLIVAEFFYFIYNSLDSKFILLEFKNKDQKSQESFKNMCNDNIILALSTATGLPILSSDSNLLKRAIVLSFIQMDTNLFPLFFENEKYLISEFIEI